MQIWAEGYTITGNPTATYMGTSDKEVLKEACVDLAKSSGKFDELFESFTMTYYGCRLFATEQEAQNYAG